MIILETTCSETLSHMGVKWLVQAVISMRHPVANAGSIPATSTKNIMGKR